MSDSWKKRQKAQEDEYFQKQNKAALERIQSRKDEEKPRLSPITGEPMEEETLMGVVIDRCQTSGGIWLDAGELEEILKQARESDGQGDFISNFINTLTGKS